MADAGQPRPVHVPKDSLWNFVIALSMLLLVNAGLTIGSWAAAESSKDSIVANREIGYRNRGATCTIAKAMGIDPLPGLCVEKGVRPYFNPNQPVSGATAEQADRNLKAYCGLYEALGVARQKPSVCRDVE